MLWMLVWEKLRIKPGRQLKDKKELEWSPSPIPYPGKLGQEYFTTRSLSLPL